jgi:hypothetical protein
VKEYWFTGFFFRMTDQDKLPELVLSIKEQWPRVVCRLVKEPFIGLGVRMTNSVWDVHDEKAGEQFFALEEELLPWSIRHPLVTFVYLQATDILEDDPSGYICRNGEMIFDGENIGSGSEGIRRLMEQFGVETGGQQQGYYFPPFARDFFGPARYFELGYVDEGLEDFLHQNVVRIA